MFKHLRNAFNGRNPAFYHRFIVPHDQVLSELDSLPPSPDDFARFVFHRQMLEYVTATLAVLRWLYLGRPAEQPIFGKDELTKISIEDGKRLFPLLLIGMIRLCNASAYEQGDMFSELAARIIPKEMVPPAERLSSVLRTADMNRCQKKLYDALERFIPPVDDPIVFLGVSLAVLTVCATVNSGPKLQAPNLA